MGLSGGRKTRGKDKGSQLRSMAKPERSIYTGREQISVLERPYDVSLWRKMSSLDSEMLTLGDALKQVESYEYRMIRPEMVAQIEVNRFMKHHSFRCHEAVQHKQRAPMFSCSWWHGRRASGESSATDS